MKKLVDDHDDGDSGGDDGLVEEQECVGDGGDENVGDDDVGDDDGGDDDGGDVDYVGG